MKKTAIFTIALLAITLFTACSQKQQISDIAEVCTKNNGTWISEHQECEYMGSEICESNGGKYFECESACRHKEAESLVLVPCTMQCVQVCKFGEQEVSRKSDPRNIGYIIDSKSVLLQDGKAEEEVALDSATKTRTRIFEASTKGDLNGDGLEDVAVILTQDPGGSGTFYYVAAAIQIEKEGYQGTKAFLLGDRIAPQNTQIKDGELIVNYVARFPWQSFAERSSVGKSKYLFVENGELKEKVLPILSQETARELAVEKWGECGDDRCTEMTVDVLDGKDGVWFVETVYSDMQDDSIEAQKKIAWAHYVDENWELGVEVIQEQKCREGRGHKDFSLEACS